MARLDLPLDPPHFVNEHGQRGPRRIEADDHPSQCTVVRRPRDAVPRLERLLHALGEVDGRFAGDDLTDRDVGMAVVCPRGRGTGGAPHRGRHRVLPPCHELTSRWPAPATRTRPAGQPDAHAHRRGDGPLENPDRGHQAEAAVIQQTLRGWEVGAHGLGYPPRLRRPAVRPGTRARSTGTRTFTSGTVIAVHSTDTFSSRAGSVDVARPAAAARRGCCRDALAGTVAEARPGRRGPVSAVVVRRSLTRAAGEPAAPVDVRVAVALAVRGTVLVGTVLVGAALVGAARRRVVPVRSAAAIAITSHARRFGALRLRLKPNLGTPTLSARSPILPPGDDVSARTDNIGPTVTERDCVGGGAPAPGLTEFGWCGSIQRLAGGVLRGLRDSPMVSLGDRVTRGARNTHFGQTGNGARGRIGRERRRRSATPTRRRVASECRWAGGAACGESEPGRWLGRMVLPGP